MAAVNALSRLAVPAFIGISLAQASLYDGQSPLTLTLSSDCTAPARRHPRHAPPTPASPYPSRLPIATPLARHRATRACSRLVEAYLTRPCTDAPHPLPPDPQSPVATAPSSLTASPASRKRCGLVPLLPLQRQRAHTRTVTDAHHRDPPRRRSSRAPTSSSLGSSARSSWRRASSPE